MPNVMTPRIMSKTKKSVDLSANPKTESIIHLYTHAYTYIHKVNSLYTIRRETLEGANNGNLVKNLPITNFSITNVLPNVKHL